MAQREADLVMGTLCWVELGRNSLFAEIILMMCLGEKKNKVIFLTIVIKERKWDCTNISGPLRWSDSFFSGKGAFHSASLRVREIIIIIIFLEVGGWGGGVGGWMGLDVIDL